MEKTQLEIIGDRTSERANHAGNVALATGTVARPAFLRLLSGAKTISEWATIYGNPKRGIVAARWLVTIATVWLVPGILATSGVFSALVWISGYPK